MDRRARDRPRPTLTADAGSVVATPGRLPTRVGIHPTPCPDPERFPTRVGIHPTPCPDPERFPTRVGIRPLPRSQPVPSADTWRHTTASSPARSVRLRTCVGVRPLARSFALVPRKPAATRSVLTRCAQSGPLRALPPITVPQAWLKAQFERSERVRSRCNRAAHPRTPRTLPPLSSALCHRPGKCLSQSPFSFRGRPRAPHARIATTIRSSVRPGST